MTESKWALFKDYKWQVLPLVKQTAKHVVVAASGHNRHLPASDAVVSTDAEALRAAAERLTSSDALCQDERYKANVRNTERNAVILASLS